MFLEKIEFHEFIESIVEILETKDSYTRGHSTRVAHYAVLLGEKIGLTKHEIDLCHFSGHLHDIGKIGISDGILLKTEKLSEKEYEEIKKHSEYGYNILYKVKSLREMAVAIKHHHERWDGKGYPESLKGMEIPLISRILAIADSFDAMTSNRSYRNPMSLKEVIEELEKNKWLQFDGDLVDVFIKDVIKGLNLLTFQEDIKNIK